MSFLKRLFGPADPLATLRKYAGQQRWAELLNLAEDLGTEGFDGAGREEFEGLTRRAGDRLATLNLTEGEAFLRAGDRARAHDHLALAAAQARDEQLRTKAQAALEELAAPAATPAAGLAASATGCDSGCGSQCSPAHADLAPDEEGAELDLETRLELALGGVAPELVERYREAPRPFQEAVIRIHSGEAEAALEALTDPACEAAQDLFFYERGTLLARMGRTAEGIADLERVLEMIPGHPLAGDVLLTLLLQEERLDQAQAVLLRLVAGGFPEVLAVARRAQLAMAGGDPDQALDYGLKAYQLGSRDPELLIFVAGLAERAGLIGEAEGLLSSLVGGGCGSAVPLPLAEFWLRQRRQLDKALETFKAAWRHEPASPLWPLRTAQVYAARGWAGEARKLLLQLLETANAPEALRQEAQKTLEAL